MTGKRILDNDHMISTHFRDRMIPVQSAEGYEMLEITI